MDPQKITELANLLRQNGDKILSSDFTLTLSGSLLRALNDSFTLIADNVDIGSTQQTFQVVKTINSQSNVFRDLQLIHDFVQKTTLLCIIHYPGEPYYEGVIDLAKFRALKRLEVQKTNVRQIVGIQPLRSQLEHLICVKSLRRVEDIITCCGGDNSNGFVWNELRFADFSYNNLQAVDTSLEFAQYLQHLNLRHNKLRSVAAIKWLPHLKTLDLSFNCLQDIPQFHMEAYKRLQSLNMSNNFVEDLMGIAKLDALTDLDLSDNCLLNHTFLLPLSALMTLKFLNLYGNPLHCHPKHRLATAQYLHKNTATVKFILDYEPLSKNEKALTGTHQLRHVGALNRYTVKTIRTPSSISIDSTRLSTTSSNTPASSVGSLRSFTLNESDVDSTNVSTNQENPNVRRRSLKMRTVDIAEADTESQKEMELETSVIQRQNSQQINEQQQQLMSKSLLLESTNAEHLETKNKIKTLREKYGADWLQGDNAEMMHSVLGIESLTPQTNEEREKSRQLFNDYFEEFSTNQQEQQKKTSDCVASSTPTNDGQFKENFNNTLTPIRTKLNTEAQKQPSSSESSHYKSLDSSELQVELTQYTSALDDSQVDIDDSKSTTEEQVAESKTTEYTDISNDDDDAEPDHLKQVYASYGKQDEEPAVSDTEADEDCYIVYNDSSESDPIFLTISSNFLREKDVITQRTKTKWGIKILESCDRLKSNTLRINFDTLKKDKQERVYTVEDDLCQELEKKLRHILSQRDLCDMNISIYRCVNCGNQFMRERKQKHYDTEISCPDCRSSFVAEIQDIPKSLDKTKSDSLEKLSPALIVEESPVTTPLIMQRLRESSATPSTADDSNSIGSATSIHDSSSVANLTQSEMSFDSNRSVVGSSNTERELEFRATNWNCESDVDIISNPSQSSIEILEQNNYQQQRDETSHLDAIEDQSFKQSAPIQTHINESTTETATPNTTNGQTSVESESKSNVSQVQLTESSSSGSVTDSICTAYEKSKTTPNTAHSLLPNSIPPSDKIVLQNLLVNEQGAIATVPETNNNEKLPEKKEDATLSSMFGALFQSTNILMSSSKKLIDAESTAHIKPGLLLPDGSNGAAGSSSISSCAPYKFNYSDFNDIDHRLKLYFYQKKFEEAGEHFKWLARGRIYNAQTLTLTDGIVVMSTCKCYLMEAFAPQHDDVAKWLRQLVSVTMDRLVYIQLLPWKLGLDFTLKDWGSFLLLLQDINRTDSLLLHFANSTLPSHCTLDYQPSAEILKRLNAVVVDEKLNMCALLNGCEVSCDKAKRNFGVCTLLTTDTHLYLSSGSCSWLTKSDKAEDIELCITQFMCNLVDVERPAPNVFVINYLDDTQNKCELWKLIFETPENAECCMNAIGQSWEQLFGVSLLSA